MEQIDTFAKEKFCYGIDTESNPTKKESQEDLAETITLIENEVE